eukprot:CAMPEP_0196803248 /NCGR_PEP_ID=MMETSP1362-20130617/2616_1 /TAXON_ID=163516 /ORGANISM="Leptocylindrus danicus, Strain CCMP1856" /LENGTH=376 /DNA_ID=CAMNT_0042174705 /DNA_START=45 /DNA_END=1175 /DNA_ORIENTATION=+
MMKGRDHHVFVKALIVAALFSMSNAMSEDERMAEYHARNYTWPLMVSSDYGYNPDRSTLYVPDSEGWAKLMRRRMKQIDHMTDRGEKYDAWLNVMASALVAPSFTESGFGITRAPDFLLDELMKSLHDGLKAGPRSEGNIDVIEVGGVDYRPLFIDQPALNRRVLEVLKPMHEAWIGGETPLTGAIAYGLRVYQGGSSLNMHVDKSNTHVISCILHIDHDDDPESEPWPILIEDFQGNTNEVVLESGDMLFYESSKCLHGRPREFKGKWYSSVFVHYYPEGWDIGRRTLENQFAVPPHWSQVDKESPEVEKLQMVGTSMKEPDCEDKWCAMRNTIKWYGPAKKNKVITTLHPDGYDFFYEPSQQEKEWHETAKMEL